MAGLDPQMLARITDALTRGQIPGFGSAQNDTFYATDNVDASHALNIRYVIPSNSQRIISARLSFHLAAYRTYDKTAAAAPHVHYKAWGAKTDAPVYYVSDNAGTGSPGVRQSGGGGVPPALGFQTSTEHQVGAAGASVDTTIEAYDPTGHVHSQVLGVNEGTTAAGVSITFDGTDKTTALGGPWSTDQVEIDVLQYIQQKPDKAYHVISLTPSGNGRIEAHLRLSYYANAAINA